ncbi:hypothetical protein INT47_005611, partial [Mucor saturninus]
CKHTGLLVFWPEFLVFAIRNRVKQVQWSSFVEQISSHIIDSYNDDHKTTHCSNWKKKFKDVSKKLGLTIIRDKEHVDVWSEKITRQLFKNKSASKSSSRTSSTSSLSYQRLLSENDKNLISSIHQNINHKWVLSSGAVVEDVIYKHAKGFKVEHPLHSYILSIDDQLNSMFTADEIKEIEKESGFTDMSKSLPESLVNILMNLKGKNDFESIDQTFQELRYDRRTQPAEYWCRNSILNYLDLFIESDNFTPCVTQQDLLNDTRLFQSVVYRTIVQAKNLPQRSEGQNFYRNGGDPFIDLKQTIFHGCQSSASNSNKNSQRELGTNQQLVRQANGDCSGLTFKYLSSELGYVEIGLVNHGANGTKELQESKLKSSKMMRSFCKQMIDQYKIKSTKIKIVSFIINGSFIRAQVMTFTRKK